MLWLKAFHIVFVMTWFAGLFYLPRLFVYHAAATDHVGIERFVTMEMRLFVLMSIGALLALTFGIAMILSAPDSLREPWLQIKLLGVALLIGYHLWCYRLIAALRMQRNRHSPRWFRCFNEVPSLLLVVIVVLAVVKPGGH
jgi:protoporphyrinogen IX oxidase